MVAGRPFLSTPLSSAQGNQEETVKDITLARRTFLRGAASTALVTAGGGLVAACGSDDDQPDAGGTQSSSPSERGSVSGSASTSAGPKSILPTYQENSAITPDLAGTQLVPPGFLTYPAKPVSVADGAPGKGDSVSALLMATEGLPPLESKNPFWQALNKRLGTELKISYVDSAGYLNKVQTMLAGGDIPDFVQFSTGVPNLNGALTSQFEDLSEFLGGDGAKDYPGLASIPTASWKNVTVGGAGLFGVPYPNPSLSSFLMARADLLAEKGLGANGLRDGQDFLQLCQELTDVKRNRFAIGRYDTAQQTVEQMVGVPNIWRIDGGKFVSAYETDECKDALSIVHDMWKSGVMHPDGFSGTANFKQWFGSGIAALVRDGWSAWPSYLQTYKSGSPGIKIEGVVLPKWAGGSQAGVWLGTGMYTFTALKKNSDKGRIRELLTLLDWFASPFGSEEYLFRRYGTAPRDYTLSGTDPVPTDTGVTEVAHMVLSYLATIPPVIYNPGQPDVTKDISTVEQKLAQETVPYPIAGLFAPTQQTKGATINKNIKNLQTEVMQGRKSLSDWDAGVKAWQSGGGDQIREEYEKSYAEANS
jgi:putative aldouronate transport system substrate-binding protein